MSYRMNHDNPNPETTCELCGVDHGEVYWNDNLGRALCPDCDIAHTPEGSLD